MGRLVPTEPEALAGRPVGLGRVGPGVGVAAVGAEGVGDIGGAALLPRGSGDRLAGVARGRGAETQRRQRPEGVRLAADDQRRCGGPRLSCRAHAVVLESARVVEEALEWLGQRSQRVSRLQGDHVTPHPVGTSVVVLLRGKEVGDAEPGQGPSGGVPTDEAAEGGLAAGRRGGLDALVTDARPRHVDVRWQFLDREGVAGVRPPTRHHRVGVGVVRDCGEVELVAPGDRGRWWWRGSGRRTRSGRGRCVAWGVCARAGRRAAT